jgi:N-methylhydantoinase A/oxoprolinase/acetone carboxylase beta subunit
VLIGIDVGGTFTDGVVYHRNQILNWAKEATDSDNLAHSLLAVLDKLLMDIQFDEIERIVLSTTLVTNLITTDSGPRTALILIPGYGLPFDSYDMAPDSFFLKGCIDFRGNELEAPDYNEINDMIRHLQEMDITRVAVAGKFANRNNSHERLVQHIFAEKFPQAQVIISSQTAQQLNFPRRAYTAYLTARTIEMWNDFLDSLLKALADREIKAPVHILKADGGTMPLDAARNSPCETIFSGPAASTMGGLAITTGESKNSVVLDIGGTTTDISLIIGGQPLHASKGAKINEQYTHVKSFAVRSIPLGGDSVLRVKGDSLQIGPDRVGPAACFGGGSATVTDAFNYIYDLDIGSVSDSRDKLQMVAVSLNIPLTDLCHQVIQVILERLKNAISAMFKEWEQEPAYKVWEVVNRKPFQLDRIIGIGAASQVIIPILGADMKIEHFLHHCSPIANALGSAVSRPTLTVHVHGDTQADLYTVEPGGKQGQLGKKRSWQLEDIKELASRHLEELALSSGLASYAREAQFFREEQFNVIRGWDRLGKMFEVGIQITPGFIEEFKGVTE